MKKEERRKRREKEERKEGRRKEITNGNSGVSDHIGEKEETIISLDIS